MIYFDLFLTDFFVRGWCGCGERLRGGRKGLRDCVYACVAWGGGGGDAEEGDG